MTENLSATPILAGQDARYLVDAIKAYRTTRQREAMRKYVSGLSDQEIEKMRQTVCENPTPQLPSREIPSQLKLFVCHSGSLIFPLQLIPLSHQVFQLFLCREPNVSIPPTRQIPLHKLSEKRGICA